MSSHDRYPLDPTPANGEALAQPHEHTEVLFRLGGTALDYMMRFADTDGTTVAEQLQLAITQYSHKRLLGPAIPELLTDREWFDLEIEVSEGDAT